LPGQTDPLGRQAGKSFIVKVKVIAPIRNHGEKWPVELLTGQREKPLHVAFKKGNRKQRKEKGNCKQEKKDCGLKGRNQALT